MTGKHVLADAPPKGRSWGKIALITMGILAAILLAVVLALVGFGKKMGNTFDANTTQIAAFPEDGQRPALATDGSQTMLLLGSDTRSQTDPDDIEAAQDGRSDAIMVVRVPADREGVYVMSIMRDSWVDIPGHGDAKINAAMAYGGVPLTVQTVEALIGSRIDRVALIDFEGFQDLTDALGGVNVNNPGAFSTGEFDFPAGNIRLDGKEALAFVRARYPFAEGDYRRAKNQQLYLKGVASAMLSRGTLTNPGRIQDSVDVVSQHLTVDEGFTSAYLIELLPSMRNLRSADITFFTAPTSGTGQSPDGQSIVYLDPERMALLKEAFETDTVGEYLETQDLNAY